MDVLELARLQFATTVVAHFMFVAVTLGLAPLVGLMQTLWVVRRKPVWERLTRFWGQVYLINYALGIITGIVMELQFGLNWTGLTHFAGDLLGASLAVETIFAFAIESTFLGLWIFGWGRLPAGLHLATFWIVTIAAYASAYWIMVANGFMQHPTGYQVTDGVARITDLGAVLTNPGTLNALLHIVTVAVAVGGFLVTAGSAWHLLRGTDPEMFRRSLRIGVLAAFLGAWITLFTGYGQLPYVDNAQPTKLAAMNGDQARLAELQAEMVAQHGPGDYAPPLWIDLPWQVMQYIGLTLYLIAFVLLILLIRSWIERFRWTLVVAVWLVPLPVLAFVSGWLVREVGRQPWAVWGEMTTAEAMADVSATQVLISLVLFGGVFLTLLVVDWWLIARSIRRGPDGVVLGATLGGADDEPVESGLLAGADQPAVPAS